MSAALRRVSRYWHLAYSKLLSLEWEWSTAIPYGATDGKVLLLNRKGIDQLVAMHNGVDYIAFLLVHESLHALLGHGWRLAALRNHQLANVAADYVINAMIEIRNRELRKTVFPLIPGALIDEALSGDKSVEQLYRELLQPEPPPQPQPQPQCSNEKQDQEDSEEGSGQEGDQDPSEDGDARGDSGDQSEGGDAGGDDDNAEDGEAGGCDDDGDSSGDGDVEGDSPADSDSSESGSGSEAGEDGGSDKGEVPDLKNFPGTGAADTMAPEVGEDESMKEVIDRMEEDNDRLLAQDAIDRQTMSEAGRTGQRVASDRGKQYSMPWATLLQEWLRHNAKAKWNSPFNPAVFSGSGLVAAGRHSRAAGTIVWVLDTSGSIGQATYDRFLGEAQVAIDDLKPEQTVLLSVSHQVCDARILEPGDMVPEKLAGGGGTRFLPAFNWVAENDIDPDVLVYLTDGEATDIASLVAPDYPVVWLSTRKPQSHYPFGEVIAVTGL